MVYYLPGNTGLHTLICTENPDNLEELWNEALNFMTVLYSALDVHFQIILVPVNELCVHEQMRCSFQMWFPAANKYFEVAHLSLIGDYIPQRLRMYCSNDMSKTDVDFLHCISGSLLSVPKLLSALLEGYSSKENGLYVPDAIEPYMLNTIKL